MIKIKFVQLVKTVFGKYVVLEYVSITNILHCFDVIGNEYVNVMALFIPGIRIMLLSDFFTWMLKISAFKIISVTSVRDVKLLVVISNFISAIKILSIGI